MRFKLGIVGLGLLTLVQTSFALPQNDQIRLIIKYKQQGSLVSLKSDITQSLQMSIKEMTPMANGAYSLILDAKNFSVVADKDLTTSLIEQLNKNPKIQYAVKDRVGYFKPVPTPIVDRSLSQLLSHDTQWDEFARPAGIMLESKPGLKDGAWAHTTGDAKKPIVIGVLDTGIALNDSLVNNLLKTSKGAVWGWNFSGNNKDLTDETKSYHGTHVAGTIAAYGDVVTGVGENLKILTLKIPNAEGMFYESAVVNAIYWSVGGDVPGVPKNKYIAKVLNMSFGVDIEPGKEATYCDQALDEALIFARKKGAVIAVAAGNDNEWEHYKAPGLCNGVIRVASTGPEALRSYFSNYGPGIAFAAPGGDKRYGEAGGILSTVNPGEGYNASGFDFYQGTSMASPHVAGVAGLIFAASSKKLTPEMVEQMLYMTTHDFGQSTDANKSCVGKKPCGHGILDAENAVKAALTGYDILFSAPKLNEMSLQPCSKSGMLIGKNKISSGKVLWTQSQNLCSTKNNFNHPHIVQDKQGAIFAKYGSASYKLNQEEFKSCEVVGYDGVGCFY